jgi:molybdenum cofactor synthesis domain-containing protein
MTNLNEKDTYTVGLIVIGNEILSGRTQDTNTSWLAAALNEMGVSLFHVRVVPDIEGEIITAIRDVREKVDYVFTTGGIGPTHDDITAQSVAKAFGVELELHPEAYDILVKHYGSEADVTPPRKKMAMIPRGASLIANPVSGAPGFQVENVFVMAGVPKIMQAMFDDVKTKIKRGRPVLSDTVSCGMGESAVAADLAIIQNKYPSVSIGSYPNYRGGVLGLSLVLRSADNDVLHAATQDVVDMIVRLGGTPGAISRQSKGPDASA